MNGGPRQWEHGVLTTGPSGNSPTQVLDSAFSPSSAPPTQVSSGTTSFWFYFRKISQLHPLLSVASSTALRANPCHHLSGLLQKTPYQPPLLPLPAFWFIIHIIHQWQLSLKPQTPALNLMPLPCFKAPVPKRHPQHGLQKRVQMLQHGRQSFSAWLCPTSAALLAMAFHTSVLLYLFYFQLPRMPFPLSCRLNLSLLIMWAPAPLKAFPNSPITLGGVTAAAALKTITNVWSHVWLPSRLSSARAEALAYCLTQ